MEKRAITIFLSMCFLAGTAQALPKLPDYTKDALSLASFRDQFIPTTISNLSVEKANTPESLVVHFKMRDYPREALNCDYNIRLIQSTGTSGRLFTFKASENDLNSGFFQTPPIHHSETGLDPTSQLALAYAYIKCGDRTSNILYLDLDLDFEAL